MAALVGYFFGVLFAAAGVGYIFLGLLWVLQIRKHWPRATYWSAISATVLIGAATASAVTGIDALLAGIATLAAASFMGWRARLTLFPRATSA